MSASYVAGLDVGSTFIKGIVVDAHGVQVAIARVDTPWRTAPGGGTEMAAAELVGALRSILQQLSTELDAHSFGARVAAIGVSGMAEAGVLLDSTSPDPVDAVVRPIIAWFDPRGDEALAEVSPKIAEEFEGRTGLPFTPLASFGKLLTHRADGLDLAELQWLNVPEFVAHALGGRRQGEISLVARTGLLDHETGEPWDEALTELGVARSFLPPLGTAGGSWGMAHGSIPAPFAGAVLTVAGHDHLVASVAAGTLSPDQLYDSMGTAEAVVRLLGEPLDRDARARLASHGIDTLHHMLPGRFVLLAGTRSGLLMRRVLQIAGINDATGRAELDNAVLGLTEIPAGLAVTGGDNADGVLTVHAAGDGLSPAALFAATLQHSTDLLLEVVARMDAEVPPATSTIIAGGWAQMKCVRRDRLAAMPSVSFSDRQEDTAFGSALVAAFCVDDSTDRPDRLRHDVRHDQTHTRKKSSMSSVSTTPMSLDAIASPDGTFAVIAMDQRNTLRRMYASVGIDDPSIDELTAIKADVVQALAPAASAFLLDPTFGVPALAQVQNTDGFGVLVAAEPESRGSWNGEPRASRDPDQNATWVRDQGGSAVKFLIQVRADRPVVPGEPDLTAEALGVIGQVIEDCRAAGVPSVIENLVYPLAGEEPLTPARRADAIIESARALDDLGPDLLKLEYPGDPASCRRLAEAIRAPWAVLSAGVDFDVFTDVLKVSCDEGGASGFIAGRAVWKDAVGMQPADRRAYLSSEGLRRLEGCVAAIEGRARSWKEAVSS